MLKILNARLQHYANQEFPDVQARFRKGRGTRDQIGNICWITEKAREFQKISTSVSSIMPKALIMWIIINCGKLLKTWEYHHLACLLRNMYTCQEATVRILYGTTDWFNIEKGVRQGCLLSHCLLDLCTEHIMRRARLDVFQAGIKIGRRNINNLRYADDTTLRTESKEELKSLLMTVKKESERTGLKLNIKEKKKN